MVCIPWFWKFKVGITSLSIGAKKRAKAIDKEMFGFPIPIMVVPVPGAYFIEQEMHRIMRPFKTDFYKGSGHSEWMNIAPLFFTVPIMLTIWALYLLAIDRILGTQILPTVSAWFFDAVFFLIDKLF
jgi:hypothetical protein